jgi:hypothetical protein
VITLILQTARFRRLTTATGLFLGAVGMFAGMVLTPWEPEATAASFIQTISTHSFQGEMAPLFLHYGWVFLSLSVLGLLTMVRHRAVVWGRVAGLLAFIGLVNLSGMLLVDWFAIALGRSGLPVEDAVGILEKSATPLNMAAWQVPGLIGVYLGLPLFLLALWRNGFVPWWPAVAVAATIIALMALPSTLVFSVIGTLPYAVALSYVGWKTIKLDDRVWVEGPERPHTATAS